MAGANSYNEAKAEMEKHLQFVAKEIGRDWKKLGRELKRISKSIIEGIDEDFKSMEEKAYQILMTWYQANGQAGATKEVLVKALQAIEKMSIAEELVYRAHCDLSNEDGRGNSNQDKPSPQPINTTIEENLNTSIQECTKSPVVPLSPTYNPTPPSSSFPTPPTTPPSSFPTPPTTPPSSFPTPPTTPPSSFPTPTTPPHSSFPTPPTPPPSSFPTPNGFNFVKFDKELDGMLKYCQNTIPDCDHRGLGHILKDLALLQALNKLIMDSRKSHECNDDDEPEIAEIKRADRRRSKHIDETMKLIKNCLSEPEKTRHMSDATLQRCTSKVYLPRTSGTVGSPVSQLNISSPILISRHKNESRDPTPPHNRTCEDLTKAKQPEEVVTRCPCHCGSCLHFEVERGVSEHQEISLDENCNQRLKPGPIQDETTADNEEDENSDSKL